MMDTHRAIKVHQCTFCENKIASGQRYGRHDILNTEEGTLDTFKWCPDYLQPVIEKQNQSMKLQRVAKGFLKDWTPEGVNEQGVTFAIQQGRMYLMATIGNKAFIYEGCSIPNTGFVGWSVYGKGAVGPDGEWPIYLKLSRCKHVRRAVEVNLT